MYGKRLGTDRDVAGAVLVNIQRDGSVGEGARSQRLEQERPKIPDESDARAVRDTLPSSLFRKRTVCMVTLSGSCTVRAARPAGLEAATYLNGQVMIRPRMSLIVVVHGTCWQGMAGEERL